MGHYDDCYAADYAFENEKDVTLGDIATLEARVKKEEEIHGYWEDCGSILMVLVASKSSQLKVINTDHKAFKIILNDNESGKNIS